MKLKLYSSNIIKGKRIRPVIVHSVRIYGHTSTLQIFLSPFNQPYPLICCSPFTLDSYSTFIDLYHLIQYYAHIQTLCSRIDIRQISVHWNLIFKIEQPRRLKINRY